jgi:hypothetical protein
MFGSVGIPELLIILPILVASLLIVVYPAARVCRRLGFHPLLGLFAAVPIANLVLLWFVALSDWPAEHAGARSRPAPGA